MSGLFLGIDVGTYSSKGVLVAPDGNVLKTQVVEHDLSIPHPGWAEQDADNVWWADVKDICHALLDGYPYKGADVAAVGLSAIGPCLLALDASGRPLRPGILYGVDTRASQQIDTINNCLGEEAIFDFSGMALTSQAIGPKILWLKQQEPEIWNRTTDLMTASSYLIFRLTGEKVIDRHTASHYMPLVNINTLEWSTDLAPDLAPLEMLPRMACSDEVAGVVSQIGASETGLQAGTPVAVGAVDALSEALSVGVVEPGDLMIMYGSTTFFILVLDKPVPDPRIWTVAGIYSGQYNLAAGMSTTGALTRWFRDEFARELPIDQAYAQLFAEAERVEPGSGGLLMLPYFSGERTPINDPHARGVVAGLTLAHKREHIFRAILEGVAFGIRHNVETFREIGAPVKRVVAVGGGAKSPFWLQIVSDVAGISQIMPEITVGASYGDAFLAGLAAGILKREQLGDWVKIRALIEPDPKRSQLYQPLYQEYLALYQNTRDIVHRLGKYAAKDSKEKPAR